MKILHEWFNGTHRVRVIEGPNPWMGKRSTMPVHVIVAPADKMGKPTGDWGPVKFGQSTFYKDLANVLVEGYLHLETK